MDNPFKTGTKISSHGSAYEGEPDGEGFYSGYGLYSIGPQGSSLRLDWRAQQCREPEVRSLGQNGYEIRNIGRAEMAVALNKTPLGVLSPGGSARVSLDAVTGLTMDPPSD